MLRTQTATRSQACAEYEHQAEKLSLESTDRSSHETQPGDAVQAKFITPLDPVIQTTHGQRLPAVPVAEAHKINVLRERVERHGKHTNGIPASEVNKINSAAKDAQATAQSEGTAVVGSLQSTIPPAKTHPLFPPLPLYGPPSLLRNLQCNVFRVTSFFCSTGFLAVIVLGALFTSIPVMARISWCYLTFRDPAADKPFREEEKRRQVKRQEEDRNWLRRRAKQSTGQNEKDDESVEEFPPLEGGPDKLIFDPRYYARRVGLDIEEFRVQTEDGFIITMWHVYNPVEYSPVSEKERDYSSPEIFTNGVHDLHKSVRGQYRDGNRRYPVLLMHGLLQSAGAYCTNDDDSLAFYLCKSGYDVWLGNNRCGFNPEHTLLKYHDPRMWAWNIRQMGVMDLPALVSRVLEETGFSKLGLIAHSQGTTQTFVALAKEQRPDLGDKISVFCALAPAVYAGPLIGKMYFKFMKVISPSMFRLFFGIHSFIPLMMTMHRLLPGTIYGAMGYRIFSFLFDWSDQRWDRGIRSRLFQFAPVYVSSESMRWWLGRECFAKHKCVLATREQTDRDDVEDEEAEEAREAVEEQSVEERAEKAWYDERVPPMALWVGGGDRLVDGRRLLRRFERGREPHVKVVHSKVIEDYEHLDVLWAMDAIEQVGKEVRQVLNDTMPDDARKLCRKIRGVEIKHEKNEGDTG